MALPIQIVVGGPGEFDPAVGTTVYSNPALRNKQYYVLSVGFGPLRYSDYTPLADGGFTLTSYQFAEDEVYYVVITGLQEEAVTSSSYTNGFNYARVIAALTGRIGFRQPTISEYAILNSANQESISGRFFDDFHALVRVKNIKDTVEDPLISDVNFNAYLDSLKRSVIMRCLNGVLNVPEQLERTLLYDREATNDQPITNSGQFVGFEICTPKADDVSIQIESASLLFDSDVIFQLYLFKDGKKSHIWSQEVTVVANEATVVRLNDLVLNYIGQFTRGSKFYFGYFQADLGSAKAIREQYRCWNDQLCFSANSFASPKITGEIDFERKNIGLSYDTYGINLEISSFRDHTNAVVKKAALFDELIGLQMAYSIIEQVVYSVQSNGTERVLRDQLDRVGIQLDLNGAAPISDSPQVTGLKQRIDRELKRVREGFYCSPKSQIVNLSVC